jgi:MEMO1 family protein
MGPSQPLRLEFLIQGVAEVVKKGEGLRSLSTPPSFQTPLSREIDPGERYLIFRAKIYTKEKDRTNMDKERPALRRRQDLEIIPMSYKGSAALLVRDYLGLVPEPVLLQGEAAELFGLLDGRRTVLDLQVALVRSRAGRLVDSGLLEHIIRELDSAGLLQSPGYEAKKNRLLADYARLEVREPSHAGAAYPAEPGRLRAYLDAILEGAGDAGPGGGQPSVLALVAPHIDLETGKKVYASAYRALGGLQPRRVILLGTGHTLEDGVFGLTEKDYVTPLGRVATDRDAVGRLRSAGDGCLSASDIPHRREHSLEFELIFLQHVLGSPFSLVPILCGSVSEHLERVSRPAAIPGVAGVLSELRRFIQEDPAGTLFVAGVDLSHIGPKFGHRERAAALLLDAKAHDRALLRAFVAGDAPGFWAESRRVRDRYNVCGLSALAFLLEILPGAAGSLLAYDFWMEEPTQSAVSFAAAVLHADRDRRGGGS